MNKWLNYSEERLKRDVDFTRVMIVLDINLTKWEYCLKVDKLKKNDG